MSKFSILSVHDPDALDAIIDAVAADPKKAAHAKRLLRETSDMPDPVSSKFASTNDVKDDEELWDNMPV